MGYEKELNSQCKEACIKSGELGRQLEEGGGDGSWGVEKEYGSKGVIKERGGFYEANEDNRK